MDSNIALLLVLLLDISLLPKVLPLLTFLVCFYIGFKLVCKDLEVEMKLRNYLARKIRKFIRTVEDISMEM